MEYDLKGMESEIVSIEKSAARLKELGMGVQAVERNADAILAFTYVLRRNISDIIE
jgi:hypothetical protein